MSYQLVVCPKCGKHVRRISMSGGSVVIQGLPVPDPEDFCVTLHPCHCSSNKGEPQFFAFMNAVRQAYKFADSAASNAATAQRPAVPAPTTAVPSTATPIQGLPKATLR